MKLHNKKLIILVLFISFFFTYKYFYFISASFNHYIVKSNINLPKKGEEFLVYLDSSWQPNFVKKLLDLSFPEYKIKITKDINITPHMIIYGQNKSDLGLIKSLKIKAPYFVISGEAETLKYKNYRPNGFPFAEIVSFYPQKDNQIWLPYISYSHLPPIEQILVSRNENSEVNKPYQIVYTHKHCIKHREKFYKLTKKIFNNKAHALGKCSHDHDVPPAGSFHDLYKIYKNYNFVLAMENTKKSGYITEKILLAYQAGAIPIYWGDSAIASKLFNKNSYIDISDFKNFSEAANYIKQVANNQTKLNQYKNAVMLANNKEAEFLLNIENGEYLAQIAPKFRELYFKNFH